MKITCGVKQNNLAHSYDRGFVTEVACKPARGEFIQHDGQIYEVLAVIHESGVADPGLRADVVWSRRQ